MRTGRPKATLTVTEDERRQLESLAHRSRTASFVARRARIVLACADGLSNQAVARRLRVAPATVGHGGGASLSSGSMGCSMSRAPACRGALRTNKSRR